MPLMEQTFSAILTFFLVSPFIRIFTVLSLLRWGLGIRQIGLGLVVAVLSFSLSLLISETNLKQIGGWEAIASGRAQPSSIQEAFRPLVEKQIKPEILKRLSSKNETLNTSSPLSWPLLSSAFLISELSNAFTLSVSILIALLVIDLLVTHILMLLGVTQLPAEAISLPLKILLFVLVDGWSLLSTKLLGIYG